MHTLMRILRPLTRKLFRKFKSIYQQLQQPSPLQHGVLPPAMESTHPQGNFTPAAFEAAVESVQDYVRAGDVIQTVLSQRVEKDFQPDGIDLYRAANAR